MKTIHKLSYSVVFAAVVVAGAQAATPGPPRFADFDLDNDGQVSAEEFKDAQTQRWASLAAQGRLLRHAGRGPGFPWLDRDGDGSLTEEEMTAQRALLWQQRSAGGAWAPCPRRDY